MQKPQLTRLIDILKYSTNLLESKGFDESRLNVELLMADVLNCDRMKLYLDFEKPLSIAERNKFKDSLLRRLNYEPLQYITGKTNFFGYEILVNESVLIPRPETEILVEEILKDIYLSNKSQINILEIGAGSGCISIAISKETGKMNIECTIDSLDISSKAINLSKKNAMLNKIEPEKINFIQKDFLSIQKIDINYDYIISNPPYISISDFSKLDKDVKDFEPRLALTDEKDGLSFYKKMYEITKDLKSSVFMEIGYKQEENISAIFKAGNLIFKEDYSGIKRIMIVKK